MSLLVDFRAVALASQEVTDLIGERLHPEFVPEESTRPNALYYVVGSAPQMTLEGSTVLYRYRVQVGARAKTALEAEEVSAALRRALEQSAGGSIDRIRHMGRLPGGWDPEMRTHAADDDYAVWYRPDTTGE